MPNPSRGKLNYASASSGSVSHLTMEQFKALSGIDAAHIPFKGAAPALADLVGEQVDFMFDISRTSLPYSRQGKLVALLTTGRDRQAFGSGVVTCLTTVRLDERNREGPSR